MATRADTSRAHAALARQARTAAAAERLQRFGELRRGGFTIQEGAWDLGVTRRTADRYEAELKKRTPKSRRSRDQRALLK